MQIESNSPIHPGQIVCGPLFSERMRVETVRASGKDTWVVGLVGVQSDKFRSVTLTAQELKTLSVIDSKLTYDGDSIKVEIDLGFSVWTRQVVRLRGIDAFELDTREGERAKEFVEEALRPESFIVLKSFRSDKYDRYLADVWYGKNEYLNQALLDSKLAVKV